MHPAPQSSESSPVTPDHVLGDAFLRREARVLSLDTYESTVDSLDRAIESDVAQLTHVDQPHEAIDELRSQPYHVVLAELTGTAADNRSLELCRHLAANRPDTTVVVVSDEQSVDAAVAAMRAGAFDLLTRPLEDDAVRTAVRRAASHALVERRIHRIAPERLAVPKQDSPIIGSSLTVRRMLDRIERVADTDVTVLVTGESGTGKELVARTLHERSDRTGPFLALNCAAVPSELLEAELFGHAKGAFTDAKRDRDGIFVRAEGGTLLLDEIGEMPLEMQVKLLRALQERRVRPVGGNRERAFDVRIVAATNRDLEAEVAAGQFREDLYYRLNVVPVHAPPLRERGNDVLLLASHFIKTWSERFEKPVKGFTAEAAAWLLAQEWPGNVRELENAIQRAVALSRFAEIVPADLGDVASVAPTAPAASSAPLASVATPSGETPALASPDVVAAQLSAEAKQGPNLAELSEGPVDLESAPSLHEIENRYITRILDACDGNKTQAAKVLGIGRRTLYRRLDEIEVYDRPRRRPPSRSATAAASAAHDVI